MACCLLYHKRILTIHIQYRHDLKGNLTEEISCTVVILDRTFMLNGKNGKNSVRQIPCGFYLCTAVEYHSDRNHHNPVPKWWCYRTSWPSLCLVVSSPEKLKEISTIRIHLKIVPSEKCEGGSLLEEIYPWHAEQGESLCGWSILDPLIPISTPGRATDHWEPLPGLGLINQTRQVCVIGFQWYIHDEIHMPSLIRSYSTNSDQAY